MDMEFEQEFAGIFALSDFGLPLVERLRLNDPLTVIDDSLEFGTIVVRETRWSAPYQPKVEQRRRYMSEATYRLNNWYDLVLAAKLVEIDVPFGPMPLPPQTWLGHTHIGKTMLGRPECDVCRKRKAGPLGTHPGCRVTPEQVTVTYRAGILSVG